MGSSRTLDRGRLEFMVAPGVYGASTGEGVVALPQIEVGARYGITDRFEMGAKAWLLGAGADAKIALVRPLSPASGFNLSLNPAVSYISLSAGAEGSTTATASSTLIYIHLPLLAGYRFGGGHEVVVGPRIVDTLGLVNVGGTTSAANGISVGSSVGLRLRLGNGFRIMPEFSVIVPVIGTSAAGTSAGAGGMIFQGGLGFMFGDDGGLEVASSP
ncbi:MAG: hypothetical protein WBV82_07460 [Myxococcaceae bacterium]